MALNPNLYHQFQGLEGTNISPGLDLSLIFVPGTERSFTMRAISVHRLSLPLAQTEHIMLKSWSDLTAGAAESVLENLAQQRAVIPPGNANQADLWQNLSQITSVSCSASRLRMQNLLQGTGLKMKSCGSTCHSRRDHITTSFTSIPQKSTVRPKLTPVQLV